MSGPRTHPRVVRTAGRYTANGPNGGSSFCSWSGVKGKKSRSMTFCGYYFADDPREGYDQMPTAIACAVGADDPLWQSYDQMPIAIAGKTTLLAKPRRGICPETL
jgi:hypothetical protein